MTPLRVLLVEDSRVEAQLLIEMMRRSGRVSFAVRHEERLASALTALRRESFDAVLLDLGLPDSAGLETLVRVLETAPQLPVVVSTERADQEIGIEAMRLGAQEYVFKGNWTFEVLNRVLRYAVERKHAERVLRQSDTEYEQLFDSHPDPLWVYDQETYAFLAANAAAVRQYGWTREEFLGLKVPDLLPEEERADLMSALAMARRDQAIRHLGSGGVWTHVLKDGTRIEVEGASSPIRFGGRPARLILAIDVTERRLSEKRLIELQKMEALAQLAGGVAQDLRGLLTEVLDRCDRLASQPGADGANLEPMRQAARRAAELTGRLLAFSGRQTVQPRVVDLGAQLGAVERFLRPVVGDQVELATCLAGGLWPVWMDPAQLEQLLVNLAANAGEAMPRGGRLLLTARNVLLDEAYVRTHPGVVPGFYVELAVSDAGEGIEPELLPRVFEPFYTTKPPGEGKGLGLATVYGIVAQAGGHLAVESEVGSGTKVHVFLPRAEAPRAEVPQAEAPQAEAPHSER